MTQDLRDALRSAAEQVSAPVTDLATFAWSARERRRRTGRLLTAAAAVAVAAGALQFARPVDPGGPVAPAATSPMRPAATTAPRPGDPPRPRQVVDGLRIDYAVAPAAEAGLLRWPGAAQLGLPLRLGFSQADQLTKWSTVGGVAEPVVAVLARRVPGGYAPVLMVAGGGLIEIDTITLVAFGADAPNSMLAWGPWLVHPGGRWVAFVQPGEVVGFDLGTGRVTRTPLPDRTADHGGWSSSGRWFLAWGENGSWRVDPIAGTARAAAAVVSAGKGRLVGAADRTDLLSFDSEGTIFAQRTVVGRGADTVGGTMTSRGGWSASGVFMVNTPQSPSQFGVLAVSPDAAEPPALLVHDGEGVFKMCCSVVGWADDTTVLYLSRSTAGTHLLAWDVADGRQWFMADLFGADDTLGSSAGVVSLALP